MAIGAAAFLLPQSQAGTFSANFDDNATPAGTQLNGNTGDNKSGVIENGVLKITKNVGSKSGSFVIDDLDAGAPVYGFSFTGKILVGGGGATPADGFSINFASFVVAVVIFTIVFAVLTPFLAVQLRRLGNGAIGATALIATLVSLVITDLLSDGFSISGVGTWIAAAVIVWLAALVAAFVLPFLGLKKYLDERRA